MASGQGAAALAGAAADSATRLAHNALLTRHALGRGWIAGQTPSRVPALTCSAFDPRVGSNKPRAAAISPSFSEGSNGPFLSQSVYAFGSSASAAGFWHAVARRGLEKCFAAGLVAGSTQGTTFTVTAQRTRPPLRISLPTAVYQITGQAHSSGTTVDVFLDVVLIERGQLVTDFTISTFFSEPSGSLQLRLARLIARRLVA
jgi:hypothetical protein